MYYTLACDLAQQGQKPEARAAFEAAWQAHAVHPEPLLCWARWEQKWGEPERALACLNQAFRHCPEDPELHFHFGLLYHASGQLDYALRYFRGALERDAQQPQAWHQLGRLLQHLGHMQQAREAFIEALKFDPHNADYHNDLGVLAYLEKWTDTARKHLRQAFQLEPQNGRIALHLGYSYLLEPLDIPRARRLLAQALILKKGLRHELRQTAEQSLDLNLLLPARLMLEAIVKHDPEDVEAHLLLGRCLEAQELIHQALKVFQRAAELAPERSWLKLKAVMMMPWIFESRDAMVAWRTHFTEGLGALRIDMGAVHGRGLLQQMQLKPIQRKFIYQDFQHRPLLEGLDYLWRVALAMPFSTRKGLRRKRQKIAIMTAHFYQNSIMMGLLPLLRYWQSLGHQLHFIALREPPSDEINQLLKSLGHWRVLSENETLYESAQALIAEEYDRSIFPEIGLDFRTLLLSQTRLAPVQIALYGVPLTSGQQSVDYFLSPRLAESDAPEKDYTEHWVGLPGFIHQPEYDPQSLQAYPQLPISDLPELGGRVLLLAGPLPAFAPEQDAALLTLLRAHPEDYLLCVSPGGTQWAQAFLTRLNAQNEAERILCCQMSPNGWLPFIQRADLLLEPWSCHAPDITLTALSLGKVVVTLPGRFLRNRQSPGLYRQMQIDWPVAQDVQDWIEKNREYLNNATLRMELKESIMNAFSHLQFNAERLEAMSQIMLGLEARR